MKTSVTGVLVIFSLALFAPRANAVLCSQIYTDCLGATRTVQGTCPDCPEAGKPAKPTDGCTYRSTPCPDGSRGASLSVTVVCGGCDTTP